MMAAQGFAGLEAMLRTLDQLEGASKRAAAAGVSAGLVVLSRGIRKGIDASSVSPTLKRAAKKTIGQRLKKKEGQPKTGKSGFGVGKQSKAKKTKAKSRASSAKSGVGVSASNIHWFVLGTKKRTTESGANRGEIDALLEGVIAKAVATSGPAVLEAARAKVSQVLARAAAKAKSKGK